MNIPTPPDLRSTVAAVATRVEAAMRQDLSKALAGCDPLLGDILEHALFSGGKRIRPLLTVLCSRCCGRDDDNLYLLATAFEYLHVATLVHDDVIDHAPKRRGKVTVAARFGMAAAILAGDWLHARSMALIGQLTGAQGLDIFCRATAAMVNGEFEQLRYVADTTTSEAQYFAVIRQKTGNLIASTCAIGALYAGATGAQIAALRAYGDRIGAAFQVIDDLLDFQGQSEATGKATGNDFIEGKLTLPVLQALARADASERQKIGELFAGDRTIPAAYATLCAFIEHHQGFVTAAQSARELIEQAVTDLAPFAANGISVEVTLLKELAGYILSRNK